MVILRNKEGVLHAPLLMTTLLLCMGGFGTWGFLRSWRASMETQLRLNRCIGSQILKLRDTLNTLESLNHRMTEIRAAIAAASLTPASAPLSSTLRGALQLAAFQQDFIHTQWKVQQGKWQLFSTCGERRDYADPLPSLTYQRLPPDTLGPQPLTWPGKMPESFCSQVYHRPRYSAACTKNSLESSLGNSLEGEKIQNDFKNKKWTAHWAPPRRIRSNLR